MWLAPFLSTGDLAVIFQDQATAAKPLGSSSVTGAAYINVVGLLKRERRELPSVVPSSGAGLY